MSGTPAAPAGGGGGGCYVHIYTYMYTYTYIFIYLYAYKHVRTYVHRRCRRARFAALVVASVVARGVVRVVSDGIAGAHTRADCEESVGERERARQVRWDGGRGVGFAAAVSGGVPCSTERKAEIT